jgi:hypothetical protein
VSRLILILTLTLATMAAVATSSASAGYTDPFAWKKCNSKVDFNLKITAVKSVSCKSAKRVMANYDGQIKRTFKAGGYRCKRVKGNRLAGTWKCTKGSKGFKFKFAD